MLKTSSFPSSPNLLLHTALHSVSCYSGISQVSRTPQNEKCVHVWWWQHAQITKRERARVCEWRKERICWSKLISAAQRCLSSLEDMEGGYREVMGRKQWQCILPTGAWGEWGHHITGKKIRGDIICSNYQQRGRGGNPISEIKCFPDHTHKVMQFIYCSFLRAVFTQS